MLKKDFIALAVGNGRLCGVRMKRDRGQWVSAGAGEWMLADFEAPPEENASAVTVDVADKPLARALRQVVKELGSADIVLTIPDEQILCQVIRVPVAAKSELGELVRLQVEKILPFNEEELSVGYEVLAESEDECTVFVATVPTSVTDEWGEALEANKLRAVRVEVSLLAWWRSLCEPLELTRAGRHAVLMNDGSGWDLLVLDHGIPVLARTLGKIYAPSDFIRELTLSFLNIEVVMGAQPFTEILVLRPPATFESVEAFTISDTLDQTLATTPLVNPESMEAVKNALSCSIRYKTLPEVNVCAQGAANRSVEPDTIDLMPVKWRAAEVERKARQRLFTGAGAAGIVWVFLAAILFLSPIGCDKMVQGVQKNSQAIAQEYKEATDLMARVRLIRAYMDRDLAAVEVLRQMSLVQPAGITLTSFTYRREEGLRISGEADDPAQVYEFKDGIAALRRGKTETLLFDPVTLTGPSQAQRGKHRFDIAAQFPGGKAQ